MFACVRALVHNAHVIGMSVCVCLYYYLSPECRMNNVKAFQILLVLVLQDVVDFTHPRHGWMIMALRKRMEVQNNVISFD